ncbi:TolB-like translocation protein [Salinimonas lutimaris]|uniref:hypothetical protein n=1 Tax=Salinimonas lutimaris TaxID=914153 RepID=UPI0010BF6C93|nr:hypothetical protein [Salinimonas lutimaris]
MKQAVALLTGLLSATPVWAQEQVANLWLFDLSYDGDIPAIEHASKLTDTPDYTNQPYFYDQSRALYYTQSFPSGRGRQTDIMRYDLIRGYHTNLTHTAASEYSPTPFPDGEGFSVIKVDKRNKQWLWHYGTKPRGKLSAAEPVGYHVWIEQDDALAFVLGETHTLQRIRPGQSPEVVDNNIGASLWQIPETDLFSYTKNPAPDNQPWTLMSYDPQQETSSLLVALPEGAYYMAWTPGAKALTAVDGQILAWDFHQPVTDSANLPTTLTTNAENAASWQPWLDITEYCPDGVSRLHISQNGLHLAAVCAEAN